MMHMKRLGRWLFHAMTALSLILCIATVGLGIRSHWVTDSAFVWGKPYTHGVVDEGCTIQIVSSLGSTEIRQEYTAWLTLPRNGNLGWVVPDRSRSFGFPGFHWQTSWYSSSLLEHPGNYDGTTRTLTASDWLLAPIAAIVPIFWFLRWRKRDRFPPGCCQNCDYDLRATADRCPECGTIPTQMQNRKLPAAATD